MIMTCPRCGASDATEMFSAGNKLRMTCPVCNNTFNPQSERSGVETVRRSEAMACPKCGAEQPRTDQCSSCGIIISKYTRAREEKMCSLRAKQQVGKADLQRGETGYNSLYNRRSGNSLKIVLVLSCLALLVAMMMWAAKTGQSKQSSGDTRITVGAGESSAAPAYDHSGYIIKKITPQFIKAQQLLNENIDLCISQCRAYKEAWYPQGEVANPVNTKFQLTESMNSNLDVIKKNYDMLKSDELSSVLLRGGKQSKCEYNIARLAALHEEMYIKAISYHSVYNELDKVLSEATNKKSEINSEMSGCLQ